jgi:predicted transcriptional regulator
MKQSKHINIRVSSELKKEYQKLVERRNQTLSEVIKAHLNSELKKEQKRTQKGT